MRAVLRHQLDVTLRQSGNDAVEHGPAHVPVPRHDAVHAVARVAMGLVLDVMREKQKDAGDITATYARERTAVTATSWRRQT
jgi:hypothetical protein